MHLKQKEYCDRVKNEFPAYFEVSRVLEIGSLDVNGDNRYLFNDCDHVGLDVVPGKNVDVVSIAHEYEAPEESFDVVFSTNAFEHDMYLDKTLPKMVELLKPGGLMFFSCARKWLPHGTIDKGPDASGTVQLGGEWANYYKNVIPDRIREILDLDEIFETYHLLPYKNDLQFWGVKKRKETISKFVSIHIPRTGGGTFNNILEGIYGERYLHDTMDIPHMGKEEYPEDYDAYNVIHGHSFITKYKHKCLPYIVWFRNPVDRVISHHYWLKKRNKKKGRDELTAKVVSGGIGVVKFAKLIPDMMSSFLCDRPLNRFVFIGITERYQESLELFEATFNVKIPNDYKIVNVGSPRARKVPKYKRTLIGAINKKDLRLYKRAVALFDKRYNKFKEEGYVES